MSFLSSFLLLLYAFFLLAIIILIASIRFPRFQLLFSIAALTLIVAFASWNGTIVKIRTTGMSVKSKTQKTQLLSKLSSQRQECALMFLIA